MNTELTVAQSNSGVVPAGDWWLNNASATNCLQTDSNYYWNTWPQWTQYVPSRPIRLTLSEVDKLRAVAKKDKAVREILRKFTPQIDIEVDFPGGD